MPTKMPEFGKRLRAAIERAGVTQKQVAKEFGISPSGLSHFLSGRVPNAFLTKKLADTLCISLDWLMTGEGPMGVPPLGAIQPTAPAREEMADWGELAHKSMAPPKGKAEELLFVNVFPLELAANPKKKEHQKLVCSLTIPVEFSSKAPIGLKVSGDSMAPAFPDGTVVGLAFKDRKIQDGKIYVLRTEGGAVVRRAFFGADEVIFRPDNPAFPALNIKSADIEARRLVVGRVAWSFHLR